MPANTGSRLMVLLHLEEGFCFECVFKVQVVFSILVFLPYQVAAATVGHCHAVTRQPWVTLEGS